MQSIFKLEGKEVKEFENDKEVHSFPSLLDFIEDRELIETMILFIQEHEDGVMKAPSDKNFFEKELEELFIKEFSKFFKEKKNSFKSSELRKFERDLIKALESRIGSLIIHMRDNFKTEFKKYLNKNIIGGNMFKTLKEAKKFTAHLDALASEIEGLKEISPDMKKHLAFRLDKLSDLVEASSANNEKRANGIGSGAWAIDQDEAAYMGTFGGTGALKKDADEPYMDHFLGDDHKEVLQRKEPEAIKEDGMKAKQPSDDYNEQEVANKLKGIVQKVMEKME